MLANHDWAAFTGREVFGDEQNSPGKNVRPDINHDVVAGPFRVIEDLARARVGRQARFWKPADDLLPEIILVLLGRDGPVVGGSGFDFAPEEFVANALGKLQQALGMVDQSLHLTLLTFGRIEAAEFVNEGVRGRRRGESVDAKRL